MTNPNQPEIETFAQREIFPDDRPHDECGIFGAYVPKREAARLAFFALFSFQHRGQESAGIATRRAHGLYP